MTEEQRREDDRTRYGGLTTAPRGTVLERKVLPGSAAIGATEEPSAPLLASDEAKEFRVRWDAIEESLMAEPRRAVEQADSLVAKAMKRLAEVFADERAKLEWHWDRDENVSTENLRLALHRYRSFFERLFSV